MLALVLHLGCHVASERKKVSPAPEALVVAVDSEPEDGFDPLLGWGRYGNPLFQSTLLRRDHEQRLVPDLAESAVLSEDRLVWRVRIRKDAVFHDGHPVTAEDVVFTFQHAARVGGKTDVTMLKEAVATGDYSLELRLREPQITFVNRLATLGIVPAHAYGPGYGRRPVGSGPYRLVRWDEGRQMVMEANERYYGDAPRIGRVVSLFLGQDAAFAAARAGTVHVVRVPPLLAKRGVPGMRVVKVRSVDNRGISFPCRPRRAMAGYPGGEVGNDVTADLAMRRAINLAIDRKALVEGVLEGFGGPAYGPASYLPWDNPDGAVRDGAPGAARRLLADGGWIDGDGDGLLEKGSIRAEFTLLYPADDLIRQGLAMAVADMLGPLGVRVSVASQSWERIYQLMHVHPVVFGFGAFDQTEMHNLSYGKRPSDGAYNAGLFQNPVVDGYLEQAMLAPSEARATEFWKLAQWDGTTGSSPRGDAPWAWLVNLDHVYLVDDRLEIGAPDTEQHGTNILANAPRWKWKGAR